MYGIQWHETGKVAMRDYPQSGVRLNSATVETTDLTNDDFGALNRYTFFFANQAAMKESYRKTARHKQAIKRFQTYLVSTVDYQPIGYLEWGFDHTFDSSNNSIIKIKDPNWKAGKDANVWKKLE